MSGKLNIVKALLVAGAALLVSTVGSAGESAAGKPHMMYFYNPSCRLCTRTNEVVGAAEQKYGDRLSHQRLNIADPDSGTDNMTYMFDLMDEMELPEEGNVTLLVFLGILEEEEGEMYFLPKRALVEGDDIIAKLDAEIADFLATDGKGGLTLGNSRPASFFSRQALASPIVPDSTDDEPILSEGETTEPEPAVVRPRIRRTRDRDGGETVGTVETAAGAGRAQSQLQFWALSGAALADSVNPCAFATIIILVAMMSSAKRTRREIIAVCLAFTASVFVTYFAIGLFLHTVIAELRNYGFLIIMDIVYYISFGICVVCGLLSLRDAYLLFSGRSAEEMALKLPKAFKKRINVAMAKGVRASWLVVGVFTAGVTVSFLEAACTGQVYLPTIMSIANLPFWHSMALLAWYNLLFVLPLLIIFACVLLGTTSGQLADFFKKNVAWTKLAMGAVFIIMGVILWHEMYWPPGYRG